MVAPRDIDAMDTAAVLRDGIAAARVGDPDTARTLLTEVTRRDASNADAWLWLASVETHPRVKRDHFERVLALRPGDLEATAGLDHLVQKYGAGVLEPDDDATPLRCAWHPDRETRLRCARCGRPMCPDCARQHPVGMRCRACMRELRSPIYKVGPLQLGAGFVAGTVASCLAVWILGLFPGYFWFVAAFLAYGLGSVIGDAVGWAAGRKRGRALQVAAGASVVAGSIVAFVLLQTAWAARLPLVGGLPFNALGPLVFLLLGTGAAVRRLR